MLSANYPRPFIILLFSFLLCTIRWPLLVSEAFNVTHLPGFLQSSLPFHLETGYIEVDEFHGVELFYYFIESERNPREDPLLLWLTGGPGCSAFSGLALEIGPLKIRSKRYNGSLPNLVYNPYSWTKISNIIFLDSPVGTGFSYSNHPQGYETGDKSWSKHTEIFLRKWFIDHQQFLSNPLYIAGDSYAGKVVPLVVHNILNENDFKEHPKLNIQGYMIGNPSTGEEIDYNARVPFAFGMGIISDKLYLGIGKNCKGENYDSPKNALCASLLQVFNDFKSELMTSHVLEPKCSLAAPKPKYTAGARRHILDESNTNLLGPPVPELKCRTYAYYLMYIWSNSNDVQEALNVKKGKVKEWQRCNNDLAYTKDISSSLKYHVNLTTKGYRALVYSGDHDMIVPFVGTKEWVKSLEFSITDQWRSWHVGGQVAGGFYPFGDFISYTNHSFTLKEVKHLWRKNDCAGKYGRNLLIRLDNFERPAETNILCSDWMIWKQPIIWLQGTTDAVAIQFFLKNINPGMKNAASILFGGTGSLKSRPNVFGELLRFIVTPSPAILEAINWVLKGKDPDIALHMRMLTNRSARAVKAALMCVKRAVHNHDHNIANPRVVLVSDTPSFIKEITPNLTEFADVLHFDYKLFESSISSWRMDEKEQSTDFRIRDWGPAPRWVAFVDFFLASRAKRAVVSGAHRRVGTTYAQLIAALAAANRHGEDQMNSSFVFYSSFQSNLLVDGLAKQIGWGHAWNRFAGPLSCRHQPNQCTITPLLPPAWWDGEWQSPIPRDIRRLEAYGVQLSQTGRVIDSALEAYCKKREDHIKIIHVFGSCSGTKCK